MISKGKKCKILVLMLSLIYWSIFLLKSDAYYIPYLVIEISFCIAFFLNYKRKKDRGNLLSGIFAAFFTLMVTLSNYSLFTNIIFPASLGIVSRKIIILISIVFFLISGYFIFREILINLKNFLKNREEKVNNFYNMQFNIQAWQVFCGSFLIMILVNSTIMYFSQYPGELSVDSIDQIQQFLTKNYTNHHSYYHTQLIHILIAIGYKITGNMNGAVAIYSEISIIIMGLVFSYILYTLYQMGCSIKVIAVCFLWYLMMPFHITYSFTMWKDVFFAGAVCAFIVSSYRIFDNIGKNSKINYAIMIIAAFGINLLRNNGTIVFLLSTLIFALLFFRKYKKIFCMFVCVLIFSFILNNPIQNMLNVKPADGMVSLSIPVQQIGRVVADKKELTTEQEQVISEVITLKELREKYVNYIADPVMEQIRRNGTQNYISQNKIDFMKIYIQIGLKYPKEYIKAWVDQTKGYWNAGYDYWVWQDSVQENSIGIKRVIKSNIINNIFQRYLQLYKYNSILHIFLCIGFHVWLLLFAIYSCLVKRNKEALFITIPMLMIVFSLLVATPVYSEFRYVYALFCSMPFILNSSVRCNQVISD